MEQDAVRIRDVALRATEITMALMKEDVPPDTLTNAALIFVAAISFYIAAKESKNVEGLEEAREKVKELTSRIIDYLFNGEFESMADMARKVAEGMVH